MGDGIDPPPPSEKISETNAWQIKNLKDFIYNEYYEQKSPKWIYHCLKQIRNR